MTFPKRFKSSRKNLQMSGALVASSEWNELINLNSEVEKLVLVLVVVLVLEIPDVWPSNYPNKIVAGKSGSFKVRKPAESTTSTSTRTRTIAKFRDLELIKSHLI